MLKDQNKFLIIHLSPTNNTLETLKTTSIRKVEEGKVDQEVDDDNVQGNDNVVDDDTRRIIADLSREVYCIALVEMSRQQLRSYRRHVAQERRNVIAHDMGNRNHIACDAHDGDNDSDGDSDSSESVPELINCSVPELVPCRRFNYCHVRDEDTDTTATEDTSDEDDDNSVADDDEDEDEHEDEENYSNHSDDEDDDFDSLSSLETAPSSAGEE